MVKKNEEDEPVNFRTLVTKSCNFSGLQGSAFYFLNVLPRSFSTLKPLIRDLLAVRLTCHRGKSTLSSGNSNPHTSKSHDLVNIDNSSLAFFQKCNWGFSSTSHDLYIWLKIRRKCFLCVLSISSPESMRFYWVFFVIELTVSQGKFMEQGRRSH